MRNLNVLDWAVIIFVIAAVMILAGFLGWWLVLYQGTL